MTLNRQNPKKFLLRAFTLFLVLGLISYPSLSWGCQSCGGKGGASETNPEGESGSDGAQFLFGIAAIIGAAAPMVVAGIESDKEQKITKIETEAQIKQTEIQTETQKELAVLSASTSLEQTKAQKDIAIINNNAETDRLNMNLTAASQQRAEERLQQAQALAMQQQMELAKIQWAQKQAEETIRLAEQGLERQRLEAALAGN